MKKTITTIILGIFVVVLAVPLVANAQAMKPQECCKLNTDVRITKGRTSTDNNNTPACVQDKAGNSIGPNTACTKDEPCIFQEGCTLGETAVTQCSIGGAVPDAVDAHTEMWGLVCLISSMINVTNWIFYLMLVFVVVMLVIGGATYMTSAGNTEKAGKGKKIIIYGIIGLVIALIARLIPAVVKMIVGMV